METPILVRHGRVLTFGADDSPATPDIRFRRADVLVEHGRIAAIEDRIEHPTARVLDATDHVVMPGFVDVHRHLWKGLMRAFSGDQTLLDYMGHFEIDARNLFFTPEDVYLGQLAGAVDAIHAGVTTVLDHAHCSVTPEHAARALDATVASGLRSVYAYGRRAYDAVDSARAWQLAELRRLGNAMPGDGRVTIGMAYDGVKLDVPETARATLAAARESGARVVTFHHAPIFRGRGALSAMDANGLLDGDMVLSHGNYVEDAELAALRRVGAGVAVTPETEIQMGHGDAVGFRCLGAGNRVGLGADCQTVCSGDMFGQMRLQLQYARGVLNRTLHFDGRSLGRLAASLPYRTAHVLRMATLGGAEVLHLEHEIGRIAVGRRADLCLVDFRSPNLFGAVDPTQALVLFANAADVRTVLVEGEVLKENGVLVRTDWDTLRPRLAAAQEALLGRIAASGKDWTEASRKTRREVLGIPDARLAAVDLRDGSV